MIEFWEGIGMKLDRDFYRRDSLTLARELLGKILVHNVDGKELRGMIVETEAYLGVVDKAAHSYGGRRTKRVETMYGQPGIAYVYIIYGMYNCFNIVAREVGIPEAVLVRAIEPLGELEQMSLNRFNKPYEELTKAQKKGLTNGPGKLCDAMLIDRNLDGEDLCGEKLYIEEGTEKNISIVTSKRIGIDYAEEAKDFPYRFYIEGNPYVSRL